MVLISQHVSPLSSVLGISHSEHNVSSSHVVVLVICTQVPDFQPCLETPAPFSGDGGGELAGSGWCLTSSQKMAKLRIIQVEHNLMQTLSVGCQLLCQLLCF